MGVTVIQLVQTFGKVTSTKVPYELKPRREGDICAMYSNGERAKHELGWIPRFTLEQMCKCDRQYLAVLLISLSRSLPLLLFVENSQTLPLTGQIATFYSVLIFF